MNPVNSRQILQIDEHCPVRFSLPEQIGYKDGGLIIAPKLRDDTLCYISIRRDSQSIVELCGNRMNEYFVLDILGRYSLYTFFSEEIKTFYSEYPESTGPLGITYSEHLFRNLQWDIVGNALIVGCARLGWFLFRKENNSYLYVRTFCGSNRLEYACSFINCADSILHEFRAERYYIKDENHIVFSGFHKEEYWYLYELDLRSMKISAFYPIGNCCDVQYLPSSDQFLIFQSPVMYGMYDSDNPHKDWNGRISVCDNTGQLLRAVDFRVKAFYPWLLSMLYAENKHYLVWYTNDEPAFSETHILNRETDELEVVTFENFINVFFNAETYTFVVIQNSGKSLQVYETDCSMRKITPVAELETTALRPRIHFIGKTKDEILLQIADAIYSISSDGIENVAVGSSFDEFEPEKSASSLFDRRALIYENYYELLYIYVDTKTRDVVFADTNRYTESLPQEMFDANGSPDYGQISRWIKDNELEWRDYSLKDSIEATRNHKRGSQPQIDYNLPPKWFFWVGKLTSMD